ncbi:PKHD-type hydroxylase [Tistlia consotensis]|uniref:PKHD-type hydroxylase n=1 Tax=Tistlia consotensis USBA 355 TaxID=560819 RepID=A0A1Y6CU75_9PROT|nr:Fe2+-dependent dioxygenase [Tistlia consotensis]SMF79828.1 PKHD-type hydroxylase [Tistlia consotensis USBA 355]SNS16559.1 PKHD-type hydroxylase [Tistlia consotensis]
MLFCLPKLLSDEELARIRGLLDAASFVDGRQTVGMAIKQRKRNREVVARSAEREQIDAIVRAAVTRSNDFQLIALPSLIGPFLFSSYGPGEFYGDHSDNVMMSGPPHRFRADLSMTVFLNEPDSYQGGELVLDTDMRPQPIKLQAGAAALYPTTVLHRVNPVTAGERRVALCWIQSTVRAAAHRQVLIDLSQSLDFFMKATKEGLEHPQAIRLQKVYSNLMQMWGEP